jgi:hypothetical protein
MNQSPFEALQGLNPVLMEVGASERPAEHWDTIAPWSSYLGIGAAAPSASARDAARYAKVTFCRAMVSPDGETVCSRFYEAADPIYSSLQRIDSQVIADHCSLRDVRVIKSSTAETIALRTLLDREAISRVDWFKTNLNGIDSRLYESLPDKVRESLLAVDTVLDFLPLYIDQDNTLAHHQEFLRQGFWLSSMLTCGGVRMHIDSAQELERRGVADPIALVTRRHRIAPGWSFARYFRTVQHMETQSCSSRDYVVLWCFALLDRQFGFCADLAMSYRKRFGHDAKCEAMLSEVTRRIAELDEPPQPLLRRVLRSLLPQAARRRLRNWILGR